MQIITFQFFIPFLVLITLIIDYGKSAGDEWSNKRSNKRKRTPGQTSQGGKTNDGHFAASENPSTPLHHDADEIVPVGDNTILGKFWMNESLQEEDPTTPNEYPLSKDQVKQGKNITLMHRRLNEDLARRFVYFYI
jgi:hypothetical protein